MSDTTEHIRRLLDPILVSLGLTLWDLEFKKEGPRWLLRVYIDRPGAGVTLDDCEKVSRDLGTMLDVEEVVNHAFTLEVSSPGLDRTLSRLEHYQGSVGKLLKIKLFRPIDGEKVITGTIAEVRDGAIVLESDQGRTMTLPITGIAKAQLVVIV